MEQTKANLVKGQKLKLEVVGKGEKGDHFGKVDGMVIFIKAKEGEELKKGVFYKVVLTNVCQKCAFAETR